MLTVFATKIWSKLIKIVHRTSEGKIHFSNQLLVSHSLLFFLYYVLCSLFICHSEKWAIYHSTIFAGLISSTAFSVVVLNNFKIACSIPYSFQIVYLVFQLSLLQTNIGSLAGISQGMTLASTSFLLDINDPHVPIQFTVIQQYLSGYLPTA